MLVAKGGRGGLGNARFATSTNRAPRKVQPGEPGEIKDLRLELKLLADVGLVGFPNAGKSTLIARISAARPKIADYPFTTLTPNLGVVRLSDDRSFVVADVPGLIEGAHRGQGLGHQFLRHLERTKVLVHLVDVSGATGRDPVEDLDTVRKELELFQPTLAAKPQIVVANKMDARRSGERRRRSSRSSSARRSSACRSCASPASAAQGVPELLEAMWQGLAASRQPAAWPHEYRRTPHRHPRRHLRSDSLGHISTSATPRVSDARGCRALFVITSNVPPHRPQPLASAYHRFAMVALAVLDRPSWRASDLELRSRRAVVHLADAATCFTSAATCRRSCSS